VKYLEQDEIHLRGRIPATWISPRKCLIREYQGQVKSLRQDEYQEYDEPVTANTRDSMNTWDRVSTRDRMNTRDLMYQGLDDYLGLNEPRGHDE
jgi:hypothetical protein